MVPGKCQNFSRLAKQEEDPRVYVEFIRNRLTNRKCIVFTNRKVMQTAVTDKPH